LLGTILTANGLTALGLGYLLGSIPFGLVLTRAAGLGDVRKIGSGNIGATNVLRTGNKKLAALTLFLDGFKGAAAVLVVLYAVAPWLGASTGSAAALNLAVIAGLGAFLGHVFPVWLGFKGGKGVATYIGVLLGLAWKVGLLFCLIWIVVAYLGRYSSLSALVASALTPAVLLWLGTPGLALLFLVLTVLLYWKHRENIARLLAGTESRIGAKSAAPGGSLES
jgi:acyl phosphate:glycerol-3-phosphate acyltransferase